MELQPSYTRFRSYYRSLIPLFEKPKVAAYTMLVLSLFTIAIFGTFAIRPTLATIAQLKKRIDDQEVVYARMEKKIDTLRQAEVEYKNVASDLEAIFDALPSKPQSGALLGKLNRTLLEHDIDVTFLQFSSFELLGGQTASSSATALGFSLTGRATYENTLSFLDILYQMDRIVTVDSIDISKAQASTSTQSPVRSDLLTIVIRGKSYALSESPPAGRAGKGKNGG